MEPTDGRRYLRRNHLKTQAAAPSYSRAAARTVISVSPNWRKIIKGENVTVTCNVVSDSEEYRARDYGWYKDDRRIEKDWPSFTIHSAQSEDRGIYWCESKNYAGSEERDYIHLEVRDDLVILQAPPNIYEGDSPTLRCHHKEGYTALNTTFYRESRIIKHSETDSELHLTHVDKSASGSYSCSQLIKLTSLDHVYTDTEYISVAELFSDPDIKVTPYSTTAGDAVTVTCDTLLARHRAHTELQIAFYRNGQKVQDFGKSNKYRVKSAELHHSGDYTCDVRTSSGSVQKTSRPTNIKIKGAASRPVISMSPNWGKILTGESVTLICNTDTTDQTNQRYYWYKDGQFVHGKGKTFTVTSAETHDSGDYRCQTHRGGLSDPIKLNVSSEVFILQAPALVYEGDVLWIRCHSREGYSTRNVTFYKDGQYIGHSHTDFDLQLRSIALSDTGTYKCKSDDNREDSAYISVAEVFSVPEIKAFPYPRTVGAVVTLTCDTSVTLLKADTELWFTFYRYRPIKRNRNESNTYNVTDLSVSYNCVVQTKDGSVTKTSKHWEIKFERDDRREISVSPNTGKIFRGENITLTCNLDQNGKYSWFKGNQSMASQDQTFVILSADKKDSGDYQCNTSNSYKSDPFTLVVSDGAAVRPVISAAPNTSRIFTGDTVTLICNVASMDEGYQTYYWYKGSDYIYITGKRFTVHSAELDDGGDYRCCTDNGDRSDPFTLDVSDVPVSGARISADREDLEMVAGDHVTFTCSVERGASPSFLWWHDGQVVDDQSGLYQITESGKTLYIESVSSRHGGTYQCQASIQISPVRTFTAESNVLTIRVYGQSLWSIVFIKEKTSGFLALQISLILVVLVLVLFILLFIYRHKLCLLRIKTSSPSADNCSVTYSALKCQSAAGDEIEDLNQGISGSSLNTSENFNSI